jgi:hypothetical protein
VSMSGCGAPVAVAQALLKAHIVAQISGNFAKRRVHGPGQTRPSGVASI